MQSNTIVIIETDSYEQEPKVQNSKEKKGALLISKHADEHKRDQIPHYLYSENKKCESNPKNLYLI